MRVMHQEDKNSCMLGARAYARDIGMVKEPLARSPRIGGFSMPIVTQAKQGPKIKFLVYCLSRGTNSLCALT